MNRVRTSIKNKEKFLLVKGTNGSGLGDRIRAVLSAILYAKVSGRNLNVIWDDGLYGPEGENIFPQLFELKNLPIKTIPRSNNLRVFPEVWCGKLHRPMKKLIPDYNPKEWNRKQVIELFSFDQSRLDYPEDVLVMWEFDQFGACLSGQRSENADYSLENHEKVRELAKAHLLPSTIIRQQVMAFKKQYFLRHMIGLHIRNSNEPGCRQKLVPEFFYHHLIRKLRKQQPDSGIFLATDNIDVETRFRHRYPNILTIDKWFAEVGEPLHFSTEQDGKLANAAAALLDMFLLAECEHLIYPAWSSFSQIASIFSGESSTHTYPLRSYGGLRDTIQFLQLALKDSVSRLQFSDLLKN